MGIAPREARQDLLRAITGLEAIYRVVPYDPTSSHTEGYDQLRLRISQAKKLADTLVAALGLELRRE